MFWGVREMKRAQLMNINRPQADIDCCYTVQLLDKSRLSCVKSTVCKDASKNPNFDNPIVVFDVVRIMQLSLFLRSHLLTF